MDRFLCLSSRFSSSVSKGVYHVSLPFQSTFLVDFILLSRSLPFLLPLIWLI